MVRGRLEELKERVLGNGRGREIEVEPSGQIVLDSGGNENTATSDQETEKPKGPKMARTKFE